MKEKVLTALSVMFLFVPFTIFPLRENEWALKSPVAEIMIACYAIFMILCGVFAIFLYKKENVKNIVMKISLTLNTIYLIGGVTAVVMMISTALSK